VKRFTNKHIETTFLTKHEDVMNSVFFENSNLSFIIIAEIAHKQARSVMSITVQNYIQSKSKHFSRNVKFTISHGICKEINVS
jgi:hypothetical protein